ncbi:hypothetical protein TTHN1_02275 [Thermus thermophilus]|uniref:DUF72 domain-containing protein n=1 Tax=Thermus thermophilus TaxID=274 RepID=A0A3P4AVJ9_THETH|nr:DUF72 domain-containing protein [Thermus thermophilus]VCU54458.1 hypothetical protein TTHN1_02275 [Thermus thermophilus]
MLLKGLRGYRNFPGGFKAYRKAFPTVELSWWHRVGDVGTISRLRALAPPGFRFSVYGHKHLTFRPSGEERRTLRRFLRRFRLFGDKRGAVRLWVPSLPPEGLKAWLDLLDALQDELGRFPIALDLPQDLAPLALERGYGVVNRLESPFLYLVDPAEVPEEGEGFLYFTSPAPGPTLVGEVASR